MFSCQSESALSIPVEFDEKYKDKKRICFFDNDETGKKAFFDTDYEYNLKSRGYLPVYIDDFLRLSRKITDASDYVKEFGIEKAENYLRKIVQI